jgi:uridine kinase
MQPGRLAVLEEVAASILRLGSARPIRVAVDGRTASGKTVLADELAAIIRRTGREIIRTSIDGFHRSKAERYARGRHSAEGYYHDARDLAAIMTVLLAPLGPEIERTARQFSTLRMTGPSTRSRKSHRRMRFSSSMGRFCNDRSSGGAGT